MVWARSFPPLTHSLGGPGEAELIKCVGKALCGSMLTNSSSLELARVEKPIMEVAYLDQAQGRPPLWKARDILKVGPGKGPAVPPL